MNLINFFILILDLNCSGFTYDGKGTFKSTPKVLRIGDSFYNYRSL